MTPKTLEVTRGAFRLGLPAVRPFQLCGPGRFFLDRPAKGAIPTLLEANLAGPQAASC